jgi:hypothetical protein
MLTFTAPNIYEALDLIMTNYPKGFTQQSRLEVETLLDHCLDGISDDSEKFLATLFIKAIKKYIGPSVIDENLYLKKFEIPQIELFSILIEKFPFVKYSQEIINHSICQTVRHENEIIIMDIGIGLGVQMLNLLDKLNEIEYLEKLTVIGIEPSKQALEKATQQFDEIKDRMNFEFTFVPVQGFIEMMPLEKLKDVVYDYKGSLIINASLALHHIQELDNRHLVIQNLYQLKPKAFYIAEPNVNHYEPELYFRFQNCYRHFSHVFQVIDTLNASSKEKNGLKLFFGREIEDIIGNNNRERFEKHEPAYRWIEKLQVAGFIVDANFHTLGGVAVDHIHIETDPLEYLAFQYKNETVLAVIRALA